MKPAKRCKCSGRRELAIVLQLNTARLPARQRRRSLRMQRGKATASNSSAQCAHVWGGARAGGGPEGLPPGKSGFKPAALAAACHQHLQTSVPWQALRLAREGQGAHPGPNGCKASACGLIYKLLCAGHVHCACLAASCITMQVTQLLGKVRPPWLFRQRYSCHATAATATHPAQ